MTMLPARLIHQLKLEIKAKRKRVEVLQAQIIELEKTLEEVVPLRKTTNERSDA